MPSGPRIRANNVYGVISDNPLAVSATTYNSDSLPLLPVVAAAHAVVVFDPKRVYGDPEIVVVTVHTASSTVATITRGQYGTSAREHPQGTAWAHVPIDEDYTEIVSGGERPSNPYRGQALFEIDTNRFLGRSTADAWQQMGFFFDPPHCALRQNAALSHTTNAQWQIFAGWDVEDEDTDNMHSAANSSRITINTPGLYLITAAVAFLTNTTGQRGIGLRKNGGGNSPNLAKGRSFSAGAGGTTVEITPSFASVIKFAANDFIEVTAWQSSGGTLAYVMGGTEHYPYFTATWIGRGN